MRILGVASVVVIGAVAVLGGCAGARPAATPVAAPPAAEVKSVAPDAALAMLREGNARFVAGRSIHPDQNVARRTELAKGQHPYAVVLSCSDSRVPPELVFDAGLGDLFVVRVAGNTADDAAIGSIEYAVEHLGATAIMVLGHAKCGAVSAAVQTAETGASPGHLPAVLQPIYPSVAAVKGKGGDAVDLAVRANVVRVADQLRKAAPVLRERVEAGMLKIVGGRYDLETGRVEMVQEGT